MDGPLGSLGAMDNASQLALNTQRIFLPRSFPQVYAELLGTMEAPMEGICALDSTAEDLAAALELATAGADDLATILEARAAAAPEAAAPAAAAPAQ